MHRNTVSEINNNNTNKSITPKNYGTPSSDAHQNESVRRSRNRYRSTVLKYQQMDEYARTLRMENTVKKIIRQMTAKLYCFLLT